MLHVSLETKQIGRKATGLWRLAKLSAICRNSAGPPADNNRKQYLDFPCFSLLLHNRISSPLRTWVPVSLTEDIFSWDPAIVKCWNRSLQCIRGKSQHHLEIPDQNKTPLVLKMILLLLQIEKVFAKPVLQAHSRGQVDCLFFCKISWFWTL